MLRRLTILSQRSPGIPSIKRIVNLAVDLFCQGSPSRNFSMLQLQHFFIRACLNIHTSSPVNVDHRQAIVTARLASRQLSKDSIEAESFGII